MTDRRARRSSTGCGPIWQALGSFSAEADLTRVQHLRRRVERYFLTKKGEPRKKAPPALRADGRTKIPGRRTHDDAVGRARARDR